MNWNKDISRSLSQDILAGIHNIFTILFEHVHISFSITGQQCYLALMVEVKAKGKFKFQLRVQGEG